MPFSGLPTLTDNMNLPPTLFWPAFLWPALPWPAFLPRSSHLVEQDSFSHALSIASYALETIHEIVNLSSVLHVSFSDPLSPFPIVLPMIGTMGSFVRPSAGLDDVLDLYLHGLVTFTLSRGSMAPTVS